MSGRQWGAAVPLLTQARRDRLSAVVLVAGGLALGLGGVGFILAHLAFLDTAERAPGEVVAIARERGARGMPLHFAIVRYRPRGSREPLEFKAKPGLWPSPFSVGDDVVVAYDPADPGHAKIVSFWTLWFLPAVMVVFGAVCVAAGRSTWAKAARARR
jgi:hypothetical protein